LNSILKTAPRELAGSRASAGFDFQKDYAICLLIKRYEEQNDFLMLLDYYDDIAILDSPTNPTRIDFYQIKVKASGNWTVGSLLKPKNGKSSILGKMLHNYLIFRAETESLNFTTNANYSVGNGKPKGQTIVSAPSTRLKDLDRIDIKQINKALTKECGTKVDIENESVAIILEIADLSHRDHSTHTIGKLKKFLDANFPGSGIDAANFYRVLFDEIKARSNYPHLIKVKADLSKKGLSKSDISTFANSIQPKKPYSQIISEIMADINADIPNIIQKNNYEAQMRIALVNLTDDTNLVYKKFREHIEKSFEQLPPADIQQKSTMEIVKVINEAAPAILKVSFKDDIAANAVILVILHEKG